MRRLPIYFVLDTSESMVGVPLASLEEGMARIVSSLRKDPHALESVYISTIAFSGKAKVISPLIDLISYYPPRLPIGGGTSLGKALNVLMEDIDFNIKKQSKYQQGDWKPLIFLITDGIPTDSPDIAIDRWQREYSRSASIVAITLGYNADIKLLKRLTPDVLTYEGSSDADFRKFIDWITASVKTQSQHIDKNQADNRVELAKTVKDLISIHNDNLEEKKESSVVLTGRCQNTKRPYLLKYRQKHILKTVQNYMQEDRYTIDGCFPISEEYFEWTQEGYYAEVNTELLEGIPPCTHCQNSSTIALCGYCEKIMCVDGPSDAICPWCGTKNTFSGGGSHFDLQRGQG